MLVLVETDVSAECGAGLKARGGGADRIAHRNRTQEIAAGQAAKFPLLSEACRAGGGENQNGSLKCFHTRVPSLLHDTHGKRSGTASLRDD